MIRHNTIRTDQSLQLVKLLKGSGVLKPFRRCYSQVINEVENPHANANIEIKDNEFDLSSTLRTIFNADTDKTTVAQMFKSTVKELSVNPTPSTIDKKDLDVVKKLMLNILGSQYRRGQTKTVSIQPLCQKLNTIIKKRNINNNMIVKKIKEFKETQPINVNIPLKVSKNKTSHSAPQIKDKPSLSLSLKDTPKGNSNIVDVLDMLEAHLLNSKRNQNDLYQIFSNILEETKPENLGGKHSNKPLENDTINLDYLTNYLNNMETQQSQKQSVLKEQQRVYNWNESVKNMNQTNKVILNDIISLFNPLTWITKKNKYLQSSVWDLKTDKQVIESEYKVLDLKTGNKEKYDYKADRLPINIQNKDMFEVVNNSKLSPEITLPKIKSEQQNNWKLLGTLYDNNNKVVFEKKISISKRSYFSYILGSGLLLLIGGFSYQVYEKILKRKSPDQEHSKEDQDSP